MGLKSHVQKRKPFLSKSQIKKRRDWCKEKQSWSAQQWSQVVFSDESHFELVNRKNRVYVRRLSTEKECQFNFQPRKQGGGGSVSLWGCFAAAGTGPLVFYTGRLNSSAYINVIKNTLPPFIAASFDLKRDMWYYQQDNAPCHRAQQTTQWLKSNQIATLEWPPCSADINPIENIWSIIDEELTKLPIRTLDDLKREIMKLWENLAVSVCQNLVESIPHRVSRVLKAGGKNVSHY
jgi:hypothetical protein